MSKKPRHQIIDGIRVPPTYISELFQSALTYSPKKDDVVVVSYPTCGATWVSQIVLLILREGRPCETAEEFFSRIPILEMVGSEKLKCAMKPGCIRTYLPFNRMNFSRKTRYIYVSKHLNDCAVSLYHHIKYFPTYFFTDGTFDEFLEVFLNGGVIYNDYYEHCKHGHTYGYNSNVLNVKYDSIKNDRTNVILTIARFLGEKFYRRLLIPRNKILKDILYFSSDEYMSSTINEYWRELFLEKPLPNDFQLSYPTFKKYADFLTEAESCGHQLSGECPDDGYQSMKLTRKQFKKLKAYCWEKDDYDEFSLFYNWVPEYGYSKQQ